MIRTITAVAAHAVALPAEPPEWVQLLPFGSWTGRDGRGPYSLLEAEAAAVIAASHQAMAEMPIDYDHQAEFTRTNGQPAPAAGWIKELAARADGLWARVEWTAKAAAAIAAREYRFISPVFTHTKDAGQIVRLDRAGLTNTPNFNMAALASQQPGTTQEHGLDELLKLLRRQYGLAEDADEKAIAAAVVSANAATQTARASLETVAVAAGLPKTATGQEIATAVAGRVDAATVQSLASQIAELKAANQTREAATAVDQAIKDGKVAPALREWALGYAQRDPAGFTSFAASAPAIVAPGGAGEVKAAPPGVRAGGKLDAEDLAVCAALGVAPEDYAKTLGVAAA